MVGLANLGLKTNPLVQLAEDVGVDIHIDSHQYRSVANEYGGDNPFTNARGVKTAEVGIGLSTLELPLPSLGLGENVANVGADAERLLQTANETKTAVTDAKAAGDATAQVQEGARTVQAPTEAVKPSTPSTDATPANTAKPSDPPAPSNPTTDAQTPANPPPPAQAKGQGPDPAAPKVQQPDQTMSPGSGGAAESAGADPVRRYESITYGGSTDRTVVGDKLTGDHIPSHAAIRQNVENTLDRPLTRAEDNALRNNTNTVVVDHDLHAAGNTYAGKNTPTRIATDAADLNSAALRDQATHLQNAPKLGYSAQDLQQAFKALNEKNAALFSQLSTKQGIMQFFKNLGL